MNNEKIYISGCSVNCAAGKGWEEVRKALFAGERGNHRHHQQLNIPFFTLQDYDERGDVHEACEKLCREAVADALKNSFPATGKIPETERFGCIIGTTGDVQFADRSFYEAMRQGTQPPDSIRHFVQDTVAERLIREYDPAGMALTISNTCVSGADAVVTAAHWIKEDLCDIVAVVGVDLVTLMTLAGFYTLSAASTELCRPFDRNRDGMTVGEGIGCVILQSESSLKRNRQTPFFRLRGWGSANDAYHMTAPHPEGIGLELAIRRALETAELPFSSLAFINAHGTGTPANDACEATTFARLNDHAPFLYFSTKGLTGHTLGASGVIELIFTMICLQEQKIPAGIGCTEPDPAFPVPPVLQETMISAGTAMSTSLAFGGCNTALIVEQAGETCI